MWQNGAWRVVWTQPGATRMQEQSIGVQCASMPGVEPRPPAYPPPESMRNTQSRNFEPIKVTGAISKSMTAASSCDSMHSRVFEPIAVTGGNFTRQPQNTAAAKTGMPEEQASNAKAGMAEPQGPRLEPKPPAHPPPESILRMHSQEIAPTTVTRRKSERQQQNMAAASSCTMTGLLEEQSSNAKAGVPEPQATNAKKRRRYKLPDTSSRAMVRMQKDDGTPRRQGEYKIEEEQAAMKREDWYSENLLPLVVQGYRAVERDVLGTREKHDFLSGNV